MKFSSLNLKEDTLKIVDSMKFTELTPVQTRMLPMILRGQNVIVNANTGTGKTVGYLIGVFNQIDTNINKTQAIIIVPTRELAVQIYNVTKQFIKFDPKLKIVNLIGGKDFEQQVQKFNTNQPHIVIGTPTRIKKMMTEDGIKITTSKMVVLDEVDMIFDLDFTKDVDYIISKLDRKSQLMVFSATINQELQNFLKKYLTNTTLIDISDRKIQTNIEHFLVKTKHRNRIETLKDLIKEIDPFLCLIFVNKKEDMDEITKMLHEQNIKVGQIHSSLKPRERIKMLQRINNLEFKYVVCSDIASRGIDLPGVSHVISMSLPFDLSYYFHRAGRTGRGKYHGYSYLFYDTYDAAQIESLAKRGLHFQMWNEAPKKTSLKKLKTSQAETNDLNKIISKYKTRPIKPGYKTRRKEDMREVITKYRKKKIKKK